MPAREIGLRLVFGLVAIIVAARHGEAFGGELPGDETRAMHEAARHGDPQGILFRFAVGMGEWREIEALADQGHADAITKWLGYSVWRQMQDGTAGPSSALQDKLRHAAATITHPDLAAILAVHETTGQWSSSWDFMAMPMLTEQARGGNRAAISLACRLAALPTATMGDLAGFCREGARLGMPEASYALAVMHHARPDDFGGGLEQSIPEVLNVRRSRADALPHYRAAAAQGHAGAEARLAHLLAVGAGTDRDEVEARRLAEGATGRGHAEGKAVLGLLLLHGLGGPADPDRARNLLDQAARAGNRMAQFTLATLLMRGQGVERDFAAALVWVHLAGLSERGDPPPDEADALLLDPMSHTRFLAHSLRNPALDLEARARAIDLRRALAAAGEWPLVDPLPSPRAALGQ